MRRRSRFPIVLLAWLSLLLGLASPGYAQVSSPSPADKATGVAVTSGLAWGADARANRYDVYLGTTNPPPLAARNLSATTYQPASALRASTTYYWRIDSKGAKGYSASGPVWSFTTSAPPPPPPSVPTGASPPSGSTGVPISTGLSWSPSTNATSYDVAFGTSSPPPVVSTGQTATNYQPATALAYSQTYYWNVTARGNGGSTVGPTWSFTTTTAPVTTARDRLRLMTWNINGGQNGSGTASVDAQAALMADSGADVIALQEVTITSTTGDLTAIYKARLESLTGVPWYQVWAPAPRASSYPPEGNLILSRIPLLSSTTTQFDTAPADPAAIDSKRSAAAATIVVNNLQVNVLATQLPLDAGQRQLHLDLFQSWAAGFQAPRIVGGSFNMVPGDSVYTDMTSAFADCWVALAGSAEYGFTMDVTNVAPNQPGRIDYWFQEGTDTHARASETWVVKTTRSDHHAVVVDVDVK